MTAEVIADASPVYASCWRRTGAMVVDTLILMPFYFLLTNILEVKIEVFNVVSQIATLIYFSAFESSPWRATPGKRLLRLCMADREGKRISPLRAAVRYIVLYAPGLPLIWLMSTDKFIAYDVAMRHAKELAETEQKTAMASLFHENSALMIQFFAMLLGALLISIVLYWLPIVFTKQKTGLHDIVTNVRVLRKTQKIAQSG
jgi:uncharacterized RDD family membrane protein YckC